MPCNPTPSSDRPNAADFLPAGAPGYVVLRPADTGGAERKARWRDIFPALSVEIPVGRTANGDDFAPMIAGPVYDETDISCGTVDYAATIARSQQNWFALHRSMDLVSRSGGGKVLIPDVRDGAGERIPFFWLGDIRIPEGVELVIDGLLKIPAGGLYEQYTGANGSSIKGWFRLVPGNNTSEKIYHRNSRVGFASGIRFAAISGSGIVDGNAVAFAPDGTPDPTRGNVGHPHFHPAWLNGKDYDPNSTSGPTSLQSAGPASIQAFGVYWGLPEDGGPPPRLVRITGITVRNTLGSCFVGALANVQLSGVRAEDSLADHAFYFSDGDNVLLSRGLDTGTNAVDLHAAGYWRGGALNIGDAHVLGFTVSDVRENPASQFTFDYVDADMNTATRSYTARRLEVVLGPRPYKLGGSVLGLLVYADLLLLDAVVQLRGPGFTVHGDVYHTGAPNTYRQVTRSGQIVDDPTRLVGIGPRYLHRIAAGCEVRLGAHRLPGKTLLFDNDGHEFDGLGLSFAVDYHPETTGSGDLALVYRTGHDLRLHVSAPERAPAGGGPGALIVFDQTDALALPPGTPSADGKLIGPLPPARGVHGVVVSGRVHTERATAWCRVDAAAIVSGLVARGLTVVGAASTTPDAALWRHEQTVYLVPGGGTRPSPLPETAWLAYRPKEQRVVFPHGVAGGAGRVDVTRVLSREGSTGTGTPIPFFGVTPDHEGSDTDAAVYLDPPTAPTADGFEMKVTYWAEPYARLQGDIDTILTATANADDGVWYPVAHQLAARPEFVHTVWIKPAVDGSTDRVDVPTRLRTTDAGTTVWVNLGSDVPTPQQIHLRARIG